MQDWAFLRRERILIVRFFHGMSMECLSQDKLGWARLPSFQVQLRAHNFLFGSSFTTCFNYANTCSLKSQALELSLVYLRLAIRPRAQFQNSSIPSIQVVSCTSYFEIRRRRFFFLQVVSRKKEKNQVLTSYLQEGYEICHLVFFVLRVPQVKKAKDFFTEELHTMAVEIREAKEAIESTRAGLLPQKGDVRKKRKRPRKVVCCNKRGT